MNFSVLTSDSSRKAFDDEVCAFLESELEATDPDGLLREIHAFNEPMHVALGERGWLFPKRPVDAGGAGLDPVSARILEVRLAEYEAASGAAGTTRLAWGGAERYLADPVRSSLGKEVTSGRCRICLGYTEPDGGSDVAMAKTRAVRDGDEWVISGSKIFTSWIQCSQYIFLVARTNPDAAKHAGLTMFLVPVSAPGIDFQEVKTLSGERTNISYYDDVRVSDHLRVGPVDGGWGVLNGPLSEEHGTGRVGTGLEDLSMGRTFLRSLARAIDEAARHLGPDADEAAKLRFGWLLTQLEAGSGTPGPMGRVQGSDLMISGAAELIDIVGPRALLPRGAAGSIGDGRIELAHRYAQGTGTYAGTVEVFRNIIARHVLGLPTLDLPGRKAFLK